MNYPLISEYIEAIKSAEDNFEELSYLRPVLDDDGLPVMTSGNFAVVFKMKDDQNGKFYAVKCFTKEQEGRAEAYREIAKELEKVSSPYILSIQYLEKELFVDTDQTTETEFPVLLMDWVEGKTLDKYLRENLDDKYALEMLAYRFSQLAQWLIPQPYAHGDLKPDNILVREDGTLVLVDYDGMYVPAMKGQKARELGSPDFRHPQRTENDFDEHIDDFPLISILLSLKLVAYNSKLLDVYSASNRLLFSREDFYDFSNSTIIKKIFPSDNQNINCLVSVYCLCYYKRELGTYLIDELNTDFLKNLSTKISDVDLLNKYIDEYGAEYSIDKKQLFKIGERLNKEEVPNFFGGNGWMQVLSFKLEKEVRVICDHAFQDALNFSDGYTYAFDLTSLNFNAVMAIGNYAFRGLFMAGAFELSQNLLYLGKDPFALTDALIIGSCRSPNYFIDGFALFTKDGDKLIHEYADSLYWYRVPDGVKTIGEYSFSRKTFNATISHYIYIPDSVERIESNAFMNYNLCGIRLPSNIKYIGNDIFKNCNNLQELYIPQDSYDQYYELLSDYKDYFREESNILEGCDKEKVNLYCLKDYNFSIETRHILEGCIKQSFKIGSRSVSISEEQLENIVRSFFDSIYQLNLVDLNTLLSALFTIEVASVWLPKQLQGRMFARTAYWDEHIFYSSDSLPIEHDAIMYGIEGEFSKKYRYDNEISFIRDFRETRLSVVVLCKVLSLLEVAEYFCDNVKNIIKVIRDNRRRKKTRIRLGDEIRNLADEIKSKNNKNQKALDLESDLKCLIYSPKIMALIKRQIALDDISITIGIDFDELLDIIENVVIDYTKLNINYFIEDLMGKKYVNIYKYFATCNTFSLNDALIRLGGAYTEDEIRLVRIQFLSDKFSFAGASSEYNVTDEITDDDLPF